MQPAYSAGIMPTMSDEDKELEAAAEAWVNLLFAQIESKKQQKAQAKVKK